MSLRKEVQSRNMVIETYKKSNSSISLVTNQAVQLIDNIQNKYKEETKFEENKKKYKKSLENFDDYRRPKNKSEMRANLK